jgi:hypothetical protein
MMETDTRTVLTTLLDRAQAYALEYTGSLSTHWPMAPLSLHALGADAAKMEQFFTTISVRLSAAPPTIARHFPRCARTLCSQLRRMGVTGDAGY